MKSLITGSKKDHKLIFLPESLVKRLNAIAIRKGVSITNLAAEALEQSLKAEEMGINLDEAVDTYRLLQVQRGSGALQIPRSRLTTIIKGLSSESKEELLTAWREAGLWYGEYLHALLGDQAIDFIEKDLLVSWNLDEVELLNDDLTTELRIASFVMPLEITQLLITYIKGVFTSLGYELGDEECLRGLASLRFKKVFRK